MDKDFKKRFLNSISFLLRHLMILSRYFSKFNKLFAILIFFGIFNFFSLDLRWLDINQNSESDSITITCEYDSKDYVLAETIKATSFPIRQYVSVLFEKQPDELYIPTQSRPLLVLHGKGILKFIINYPEGSIEKLFVSYSTYDFKEKKQSPLKNISVFPGEKVENLEKNPEVDFEADLEEKISYEDDEIKELINEAEAEVDDLKNYPDQNEKTSFIFNLFNLTKNSFLIFILIFFVGIFMSMTPCMYPMIPITLSILEIEKNNTRKKNIIKSFFYTLGIATTFSFLGILSVSGKFLIGSLFSKDWFLYIVVFFFFYMIMTMFDILKMKSFSLSFFKQINLKGFFGTFFYGVFSGTIFSPCVSPGLFALLTFASEEKSYFIAALMLFIFGLGMGFPFMVLSFFYQELNLFPRAGFWMNFSKYLIGLMLIFLWISYLNLLFTEKYTYLIALICVLIIFYNIFNKFKKLENKAEKKWNKVFILILLGIQLFFVFKIYKDVKVNFEKYKKEIFFYDLEEAKAFAIENKKFLLIDFSALWCSSCNQIDKKFFKSEKFLHEASEFLIFIKIIFDKNNVSYSEEIASSFDIKGLPTIILLNPINNEVLAKFDSSILDLTEKEFLEKMAFFCRGENENL